MATTEELSVYLAVAHGVTQELGRDKERHLFLQLSAHMMVFHPEEYFQLVDYVKERP